MSLSNCFEYLSLLIIKEIPHQNLVWIIAEAKNERTSSDESEWD